MSVPPIPKHNGTALVEGRGITQSFDGLHVLGPVDLSIARGDFVSVVGPSGCGKSTLLEVVGALQDPASGVVEIHGEPLRGPREGTAIVFQEAATLPWRTVLDNVAFALEAKGVRRRDRRARAAELLDVVGLSGFGSHYPSQLSGGMRQRVAMARAISREPDLILADEPFGALDEQTRMLMAEELMGVVERVGCGVLLITHSIQEAILLSDRILVMSRRPGRIIDTIEVDLPRPRRHEHLGSEEATAIHDRIWSQIKGEAAAAMGAT